MLGRNELIRCPNQEFTPASYMVDINRESISCYHHFFVQQYLPHLYCDDRANLRKCVGNPCHISFDNRICIWTKINDVAIVSNVQYPVDPGEAMLVSSSCGDVLSLSITSDSESESGISTTSDQ